MAHRPWLSKSIAIAKFVILAGIVVWLVRNFPRKDWDTLVQQEKNWLLLGQGFLLSLSAYLISFWRWQILLSALDVPMRLLEAIRLGFLGTLLNQVSVGSVGGDLFKAIEAARNAEGKRTEVVASILVDRAIGLLGLFLVACVSLVLASNLSPSMVAIKWGALCLSLIGLGALIGVVLIGKRIPVGLFRRIPWVGHTLYRLANAGMVFQGRPRLLVEMVTSSMMVHTCFTLSCIMISNALYSVTPRWSEHFMVIPPAMAAATLPLTPGGVGVFEVIVVNLFAELKDVPENFSPLIVAGVFRLLGLGVTLLGAIYYFAGIGKPPALPTDGDDNESPPAVS